jgi:N-methylhydantoinase A
MQSVGGLSPSEEVKKTSVATLYSGPVGGIVGAQMLGRLLGEENIITTDMGGTSFDVGLIVDGMPQRARTTLIGRYITMVPSIEAISIGAGGGSIAWIDEPPALRVGPQSAGADPGPACYGRGGELPTVTDCDVILGYINPDYFLGGRMKLDVKRAEESVRRHVAERLGMSVVEAAAAVYEIVNAHMADLVRKVSIERGHDPREFTLFAFGGAGPTHCTAYGPELEVKSIVVPRLQTVFSAFGIAQSDIKHFYSRSYPMVLEEDVEKMDLNTINSIFRELSRQAMQQLSLDGVERGFTLSKSFDVRYRGQIHELTIALPWDGDLGYDQLREVRGLYERQYEMLYGSGAASKMATPEIITFRLDAIASTPFQAKLRPYPDAGSDPSSALVGRRPVYWLGEKDFLPADIYIGEKLLTGNRIRGPAVIELFGSSIPLPPGQQLSVDRYLNFIITPY